MRVTNSMLAKGYLKNMNRNLSNIQTLNRQLSTGKEISRPSDNPYKCARSMQLNTDINTNVQYNENIKDTINYLESTDEALYQATNCMQRIRELLVSSGNAAYGSDERNAISDEINERVEEMAQILNTNFDGKYIFGGTKVSSKPVDIIIDPITGNKELTFVSEEGKPIALDTNDIKESQMLGMMGTKLNVEISQGVKMEYNVTSMEMLNFKSETGESVNVINLLGDIVKNLQSSEEGDNSKLINENLKGIDNVITNLLKTRSEVGAKQNRMEAAQTKNEDENLNMTDILSRTEDIDFTQKTIEFSMAQTVYTAALQVSAQVLPKSLLDYL